MRKSIRFRTTALIGVIAIVGVSFATYPGRAEGVVACEAGMAKVMAHRVQAHYEGIRDIRAQFAQTNESATFGGEPLMAPDRKTGEVVFAKPGKMRWSYQAPEPSLVVSNGRTLWIHDVAAQSVARFAVTSGFLSGAALQFLLGDGRILDSFEVEASNCDSGLVSLDLVPKADSTYERLGLVVQPGTGGVIATSVTDLFGNVTRIEFSGIETNLGPGADIFEFEVPDGVEVIEYDGTPRN